MAGAFITADVDDTLFLDRTSKMIARAKDLSPPFQAFGEVLLISHEQRFNAQVSPDGKPWSPLSERYQESKPRNRDKILTLDGHLRRMNYEATAQELRFGTPMIYGATHQFGDEERGIPARPFIGVPPADGQRGIELVRDYIAGP